ncbi:PD-(D/E)XK nuclease family protein [Sulfurimonas sp.]
MDIKTIVLSSARAIRQEQLKQEGETLFLPNFITMSEFISKLTIVENYKFIDDDTRILLLLEASDFKTFEKLQIERNFFTFTKNSSYIFKFYEELSAELYDINNLVDADLYAEYEEHISILQELYKRYEELTNEKKLLDKIFLPKLYAFNSAYLKQMDTLELYIDGYLTNFEFELLEKSAECVATKIFFNATRFNKKMQEKLHLLGFDLEVGYAYELDFTRKTVLNKQALNGYKQVSCESVSEPLLQIGFIKQKIYDFIQKGYKPEKIAVVLPNESSAKLLKSFDEKSNLNFAMGESFRESKIYKKLHATLEMLNQESYENRARLHRVGDELYTLFLSIDKSKEFKQEFLNFLNNSREFIELNDERKIYDEELYAFEKLLPFVTELSLKSLLNLFMSRLSKRSIDDIRGGKITVMGVLETRSIRFDGVIIIDFDDKSVPKRSDKDMFLNTQIREMAKLPTMSDRENLQKHYYEMLLSGSQESALCYVASKESSASRFLKQLGIKEEKKNNDDLYAVRLFHKNAAAGIKDEDITLEYSFKNIELSASRLKTYLSCKRKYYYKYILKINKHTIPKDMPQEHEIGVVVHNALANLYTKKNSYNNLQELQIDLHKELDLLRGKSELDIYLIALQKKALQQFCQNEIARFGQGYEVLYAEKKFHTVFEGMQLGGVIDRIDKKDNCYSVLDYKTGSYTLNTKNNFSDAIDFQLEFYYLLAAELGAVEGCAFYDLKEGIIIPETFLEEKIEILRSHIKDLQAVQSIETCKTDDIKHCKYCEYALMCGRD